MNILVSFSFFLEIKMYENRYKINGNVLEGAGQKQSIYLISDILCCNVLADEDF